MLLASGGGGGGGRGGRSARDTMDLCKANHWGSLLAGWAASGSSPARPSRVVDEEQPPQRQQRPDHVMCARILAYKHTHTKVQKRPN